MSEQNKRIARKVFEDIQSQGNLALVDELVAADYVGHSPLGDIHGPEGTKQLETVLKGAFPDYRVEVEDQIVNGDKVVTRWTARGTHQGPFQRIPPTGKSMTMTGMTIFRIADGKLVEGWTNADILGLLVQLGAVPAPGQAAR
jgi:steroid delta-isomerase-like uncharacterized protein